MLELEPRPITFNIEQISNISFRMFEKTDDSSIFFNKAGIKVRPSFLIGEWQAQDDNGRELFLEADGSFTLTSEDSQITGEWAQQDYELLLEPIGEYPVIRYELVALSFDLELGKGFFIIKEQPSNAKIIFFQ